MISVEEARSLIARHAPRPAADTLPLFEALGCVLAEDVKSPIPMPSFDNSAMDGFAFRSEDTRFAMPESPVYLPVKRTVRAGDTRQVHVERGQAVRIMTGARMPEGADVVLPVECSKLDSLGRLIVKKTWPSGHNIRLCGEELKKNDTVLRKGALVTPPVVGILSSLGKNAVKVFPKPRVSVIATGSELVKAGKKIVPGKIYDSNLPMVRAALLQSGIHPVFTTRLGDSKIQTERVLIHAFNISDVVILTGGVSAGETDHVKPALKKLRTRSIFWKVSQKPGKPLYFGKKGRTLVFGLPGNPAAVFVCFYEYVYPALRRFMNYKNPDLREEFLPLDGPVKTDPEKTLFLKAAVNGSGPQQQASSLPKQASHMISSLAQTRGILVVPKSAAGLERGQTALFHALPFSD